MTRAEHILSCFAEECNEVAQRVSKALRFGVLEVQPGQTLTNAERIVDEYIQIIAVERMLVAEGIIPRPQLSESVIAAKQQKIEKFIAYAREQGALQEGSGA